MSASSSKQPSRVGMNTTASRFLSTMRQSFSYAPVLKKRQVDISEIGMYSTPEEHAPRNPVTHSHSRSSATPPTIEQIAMGLHVSRTPHLGPISKQNYRRTSAPGSPSAFNPYQPSRRVASPCITPPPPSRSSMKKTSPFANTRTSTATTMPGLSVASMSSTTVTSITPSTPSRRSSVSLKSRMSRFLPGSRYLPLSVPQYPNSSDSVVDLPPRRKAVRFSTGALGRNEIIPTVGRGGRE